MKISKNIDNIIEDCFHRGDLPDYKFITEQQLNIIKKETEVASENINGVMVHEACGFKFIVHPILSIL